MGYTLQGLLLDAGAARHPLELPAVPLAHGLLLVPVTDAVFDALPAVPLRGEGLERFWKLNGALEAMLMAASQLGRAAYIEAEFFGGQGDQTAAGWRAGRLAWGPEQTRGAGAVNQALRWLGVPPVPGGDEFEAAGLGRCRHTADWLDQAP